MESVKKLTKITIILGLILFIGRFVYINVILPVPFKHELETCLANSQKLNDPLEVEIAEELCLSVYPHFN
mgnify:CR=1 FL=1